MDLIMVIDEGPTGLLWRNNGTKELFSSCDQPYSIYIIGK